MPVMSDATLKAMLTAERNASLGGTLTSDLSSDRAKAMDYYNGEMNDMPAPEGRSKAISTDVADTIEGLMPSLMEIFAAGEEVVRFDPVSEEDEDAALQETDYVNHVFMQKNPGFMVLYSFIKDALLQKNGIVKVRWDTTKSEERETYLDQDDGSFAVMAADPDAEIVAHTENTDPDTKQITHDVTIVRKKGYGCARVEPVPPEEFGISKYARTIKDANYCFHEPANTTEADLIDQGYDETQVKALPTYTVSQNTEETQARDTLHVDTTDTDTMNRATRRIKFVEHYVKMDYEGDGEVCLYRVATGGNQLEVLKRDGKPAVTPEDVMPFAAMTPIIITHRFFGKSIADIVMDIQRIKTALIRQLLDNIYLANNQRHEVSESHAGPYTIDDLMVNRPGGVVRTKQPGGLREMESQSIGAFVLPVIEYVDATREWRTGVTRQGQGLDANALQNQSATAVNQAFTAAQARMKLIARIFAETGVRDLFSLLHGCIRKNDKKANTVRLRNKWVRVDPRNWKSRDDMTINVGLGTGSRQEQVGNLMNMLNIQKEIMLSGPSQQLVKPKNVYNTLEKLIERVGLKTIEPYFSDPEGPETGPDGKPIIDPQTGQPKPKQPPQQPPDPKMIEVQGKLQLSQQQAQADIQMSQQKLAADAQGDQAKMAMEADMKHKQMVAEFNLKQQQMAAEFQLKREQMQAELQLQREQFQMEHQAKLDAGFYKPKTNGSASIDGVRMGGEMG